MIAREKTNDGMRITFQDMDEGQYYSNAGAAVQRLDQGRGRGFPQVCTVIPFVGAGKDEHLPIGGVERFQPGTRLLEKARITDEAAELLRSAIAGNPPGQASQANSIAACQEHSPEVGRCRKRNP